MHEEYPFKEIESNIQGFWDKNKTFSSAEISNKEKKIIDRECGDLIEKYFSERPSI